MTWGKVCYDHRMYLGRQASLSGIVGPTRLGPNFLKKQQRVYPYISSKLFSSRSLAFIPVSIAEERWPNGECQKYHLNEAKTQACEIRLASIYQILMGFSFPPALLSYTKETVNSIDCQFPHRKFFMMEFSILYIPAYFNLLLNYEDWLLNQTAKAVLTLLKLA